MKAAKLILAVVMGVGLTGIAVSYALRLRDPAPPVLSSERTVGERGVASEGRVVTYPGAEVVVGAERGGRLVQIRVEENQKVKKGDLLAEIDSAELRSALEEARARVAEAEAEVRLGELNLRRRRELVEQGVLAAQNLDQALRDLDVSRARLETGRAEVSRYEVLIGKTRILAPISGKVIARHVDAGETVKVGDPIATLADVQRLRIEGEADEADAGAIMLGASVLITADGYPGKTWKGRVEEIADSVTPRRLKPQDPGRPSDTRILTVKVAFVEPTPLKLGTTVDLRIETGSR